jgi:hypothetical protein
MMIKRKIGFVALLFFATSLVQNVSATLIYLPDSSYAEAEGNWQGSRIYEENGFNVLVDFTVYDTENLQLPGESALASELGMAGQYIYAYQIFNHPGDYNDVRYFQILNLDGTAIAAVLDDIGSHDDSHGGLSPADALPEGLWKFDWGVLIAGEHSYFLVFSSNYEPVAGNYEIKGFEEEGDLPVPEVPEPGMLTLLGLGGTILFAKRRNSVVKMAYAIKSHRG